MSSAPASAFPLETRQPLNAVMSSTDVAAPTYTFIETSGHLSSQPSIKVAYSCTSTVADKNGVGIKFVPKFPVKLQLFTFLEL